MNHAAQPRRNLPCVATRIDPWSLGFARVSNLGSPFPISIGTAYTQSLERSGKRAAERTVYARHQIIAWLALIAS